MQNYYRTAILWLSLLPSLLIFWLLMDASNAPLIDWDTASYLYFTSSSGAYHAPDGTHLLLGGIYYLISAVSTTREALIDNTRIAIIFCGILTILLNHLSGREIARLHGLSRSSEMFMASLCSLLTALLPAFQYISSTMDDNCFSYPWIALAVCLCLRFMRTGRTGLLLIAGCSIIIAILLTLAFAPFGALIPLAILARGWWRHTPALTMALQAAVSGMGSLLFFLLAIAIYDAVHPTPALALLLRNYPAIYHPDASYAYFWEFARVSWTRPLTGCLNLNCSIQEMSQISPQDVDSRPLRTASRVLALLPCLAGAYLIYRRDYHKAIFVGFAVALVGLALYFLGFTKSLDAEERFDILIFLFPLLIYATWSHGLLRYPLLLLIFGTMLLGGRVFLLNQSQTPRIAEFRNVAAENPTAQRHFFSVAEIPVHERRIWFTAWAAGLNPVTVHCNIAPGSHLGQLEAPLLFSPALAAEITDAQANQTAYVSPRLSSALSGCQRFEWPATQGTD